MVICIVGHLFVKLSVLNTVIQVVEIHTNEEGRASVTKNFSFVFKFLNNFLMSQRMGHQFYHFQSMHIFIMESVLLMKKE